MAFAFEETGNTKITKQSLTLHLKAQIPLAGITVSTTETLKFGSVVKNTSLK